MTLEISLEERVEAVRRFNRFFTRRIGVLREGLLHSPFSPTEARILFELAANTDLSASALGRELGLDGGHLSRALVKLEEAGLLERIRSETDGRQRLLKLTEAGYDAFALLDQRSKDEVSEMLEAHSDEEQRRLLSAMDAIGGVLDRSFKFSEPFVLRGHEPGDLGWVTQQHALLYAREFGWDGRFEGWWRRFARTSSRILTPRSSAAG